MDCRPDPDNQSSLAKKYQLERKLRATKQGERSIQELYETMAGFWNQLIKREPSDLIKLNAYRKHREEERLIQFLLALRDEFEPLRKSILGRSFPPTVEEALWELKNEETRLKRLLINSKGKRAIENEDALSSKLSSISVDREQDDDKPALLGGLAGNVAKFAAASFAIAQVSRGLYNYLDNTGKKSSRLKILTYNIWFREDVELHERMKALGDLIELHSPDVICLQEVTPNIYNIFKRSNWWKSYGCLVSNEKANIRRYFCMQLSKLPVKSFSNRPYKNSVMGRELCMAKIEVGRDKHLIVATSHLESMCPAPPTFDQMFSEERIAQAKESMNFLKNHPNVIFCGDMNWDDEKDGPFPLLPGWIDAWAKLRARESGWTYDTKSNPMISANYPSQKRLDRFICKLQDFKLETIEMIGTKPIQGCSYYKEKKVKNKIQTLVLPVLPSDHYGLLLEVHIQ